MPSPKLEFADLKVRAICETAELTRAVLSTKASRKPPAIRLRSRAGTSVIGVLGPAALRGPFQITDGHARLAGPFSKTLVSIIDEDPRVGRILFVEGRARRAVRFAKACANQLL